MSDGLTNYFVYCLAINKWSEDIFACTYDGVFRSTDNGDSWTQINNGLTAAHIEALAINSSDDVFAGSYGGAYSARLTAATRGHK